MDLNRVYVWEAPTKLVFGPGCSRQTGQEMQSLGGRRALIVTDRGVRAAGVLDGALEGLEVAGISYAIYDGVEPNPSLQCANQAAALYRQEGCDCLLAVGGGSSMDTAKAAGAAIANPTVDLRSMDGRGKIPRAIPPLIAVPTTCGTGSEVTLAAVITDTERRYKMGIGSPHLLPRVALIDATLLVKLPGAVIASTAMDALCHALESYTNLNAAPFSDALNLHAMSTISRWLRPAVANGNLEALSHLILASTMAGMSFSNTRLSAVHAMSHPVSAYFGVPHGVANAILLPHVMEFNLSGNPERFGDVARALGEDTTGVGVMGAARLAVKGVKELSRDVGIPETLGVYGVSGEHLDAMIEDAVRSGSAPPNPVRVTREAVKRIYLRAMGQ